MAAAIEPIRERMFASQHLHALWHPLQRLAHTVWAVAKTDLHLFRRYPRLLWAAVAIVLVPAAYALIYLSSVWDPNEKTNELPVGLVNLDHGMDFHGTRSHVGAELLADLQQSAQFGYQILTDETQARDAVRRGKLAFAVVVPEDFSASALPGTTPGGGKVLVILSEGNNYVASGIARRFATELGHRVNEALNEKRWEHVLNSMGGKSNSLETLREGVTQLRDGARSYDEGMARYNKAGAQLVAGFKQLSVAARTLEARLPNETDLRNLRNGTQRLANAQREMGNGLEQLHQGAQRLTDGAKQLQEESAGILFVGDRIGEAAGQIADGGQQLSNGLGTALESNARMSRGATRIEEATGRLTEGLLQMNETLRGVSGKLPEDERLDAYLRGGQELLRGAAKMRVGLELVTDALPDTADMATSSARGLADSVEPRLEVLAPVPNNGSGFAPNMVAMALWLGAVMALYLFNVHRLSEEHADASPWAKSWGRMLTPALLVLIQASLIWLVLELALGVPVPNRLSFLLVLGSSGLAFLGVVMLLMRALGELGKLCVILLLTLQLAAGGGVMPIELTADVFQGIHDWLPFTWVIKALRASLFGAYGQGWLLAWAEVTLIGLVAWVLSGLVHKWHVVPAQEYRAAVEI